MSLSQDNIYDKKYLKYKKKYLELKALQGGLITTNSGIYYYFGFQGIDKTADNKLDDINLKSANRIQTGFSGAYTLSNSNINDILHRYERVKVGEKINNKVYIDEDKNESIKFVYNYFRTRYSYGDGNIAGYKIHSKAIINTYKRVTSIILGQLPYSIYSAFNSTGHAFNRDAPPYRKGDMQYINKINELQTKMNTYVDSINVDSLVESEYVKYITELKQLASEVNSKVRFFVPVPEFGMLNALMDQPIFNINIMYVIKIRINRIGFNDLISVQQYDFNPENEVIPKIDPIKLN